MSILAGDQTVVAITPENGGSVTEVPEDVVLTFARSLDGADVSATSTGPDSSSVDVDALVEGATVAVPVIDEGPGDYTIQVTVDGTTSSTGFTVLRPGEEPPVEEATYGPLVVGAVLVALLVVAVLTLRRWFRR